MQPSVSPCSTPYSVFDAIKDGDWDGLLALYVKTASDAVHSAEFASRGGGIDLRTHPQLSDIPTRGVFHEGEESISSINASLRWMPTYVIASNSFLFHIMFCLRNEK